VASLLVDSSFLPNERQTSLDSLPIGLISLLMAIPTVIIGFPECAAL